MAQAKLHSSATTTVSVNRALTFEMLTRRNNATAIQKCNTASTKSAIHAPTNKSIDGDTRVVFVVVCERPVAEWSD
eukprot:CAMPEP_0194412998 /NCGR_PEP_ID=MMETSP0176-20130528/11479_1 /TAXON_ID=216777 /ORGANISM="Proboscia alata, Strain PI-D3" /LENGTH=75 /DNA_ID=CAMNT_0039216071 /DNA_START=254 /DNA_END=478 /DNA_ORIENTATION=+